MHICSNAPKAHDVLVMHSMRLLKFQPYIYIYIYMGVNLRSLRNFQRIPLLLYSLSPYCDFFSHLRLQDGEGGVMMEGDFQKSL